MRIELYLDSEKGVVRSGENRALHRASASFTPVKEPLVKMAFVDFSEKEMEMRNQLERIAAQFGIEFSVYDIAGTRNALRAFCKGVRETPTVIIGKRKLTGNISEAQIVQAIKEQNTV